jgi:nitroreductase/NAD-dependent dihydropyrimidine dehydrogenase PreA subunit
MSPHVRDPTIRISVDENLCRNDGLCAQVCPNRVFTHTEDEPPRIGSEALCCLCGQCLAVCPSEAITHSRLDGSAFEKIADRHPVEATALGQLLRQRRSVRVYKAEEIPKEVLERVIEAGGFGPTGAHGGEGWVRRVAVVAGRDEMKRVAELTRDYMAQLCDLLDSFKVRMVARWSEGPRIGRLMLPDMRMRLAEYAKGLDLITYGAPAALFVHSPRVSPTPQTDCDCVMYPMMLMAHALDLGTCWNGYLSRAASGFRIPAFTAFRKLLELPDHHDVYAAATIGYPRVKLHSVPPRETRVRFVGHTH